MNLANGRLRSDSKQTQEQILQACVALFTERGYAGTSMRAIADAAGVNVAAANYHFGSKRQLFEAAFISCVQPINDERLRRLDELQNARTPPQIEDVVRAFVDIGFALEDGTRLPGLVARLFVEPAEISVPLLQSAFAPTAARFMAALGQCLPDVDPASLQWRFHYLIGAMLQLARFERPLMPASPAAPDNGLQSNIQQGIDELVGFVVAGLSQPNLEHAK